MIVGPRKTAEETFEFTVWAPLDQKVDLEILTPAPRLIATEPAGWGYWRAEVAGLPPDTRYRYVLNGGLKRPDPASHFQPEGVHGPSALVDHDSFPWTDHVFRAVPLTQLVIYELHIGTFTPQGTFDAVIDKLDYLVDLGVNAVEIMPVAQFPGNRNWGYDGAYPFAVQNSYGGPEGLKRLVNVCHQCGLSVILDVVYNHLGPEGNYLGDFGPYFTEKYQTPWGRAVNFDGPYSDGVRRYFLQNAWHWFHRYHIDGLRLDATHAIFDQRPQHFLEELAEFTENYSRENGRRIILIAESNLNDPGLATPRTLGGMGLDSVWNDDFHHAVHTLLTGENTGYYQDYGRLEHLAEAIRNGFCYQGQYSKYRQRGHGRPSGHLPGCAFVNAVQTHDQVGNRRNGEHLTSLTSFEALKLAAGLLLLTPAIPMIFMGEEYGEDNPFLYFVSHGDPDLIEAVRRGRQEEFKDFEWSNEPPDPQAEMTFRRSKLDWSKPTQGRHKVLLDFYKELLYLRKRLGSLSRADKTGLLVWPLPEKKVLVVRRREEAGFIFGLFNLSQELQEFEFGLFLPPGGWRKILDSAEAVWLGPGPCLPERPQKSGLLAGYSLAVYWGKEG